MYNIINKNIPSFKKTELKKTSYETYAKLDKLGRCGVARANIGRDIMPKEKRGAIGSVKPTGWHTVKYDIVDGNIIKMPYPNTTGPEGSVFITWYNMDAGPGNYMQVKQKYTPSTSVSFKAVWGYPLEGHLVYDDPDARDENIVYTFFNWKNEWIPYDPSKIGDPSYGAYYYSIELKNSAIITKDRFYVMCACTHNPQTRGDAAWTYFANGEWKHERVGATKKEIGG